VSRPPVTVVPVDDPAWDEWLARTSHDVYHRAGYHTFATESDGGDALLVVVGNQDKGLAWPYILRSVPGSGLRDVTSVYGYPGPVAWGVDHDPAFIERAWACMTATWREQGAVTAFTRFHPLLGNADLLTPVATPPRPGDQPTVVFEGHTVAIDCSQDDARARAGYRKALRQEIAASRRAGLKTEHDTSWTHLPDFVRLYRATMDRGQADSSYYVTAEQVQRLRDLLDGDLHLLVTRLGNAVAAVGLFTRLGAIAQAHLVGTDETLPVRSPLKVLLDDARHWARAQGCSVLHLGGGRGAREDSLFAFKKRFSPLRYPFHTGRWVLDQDAYRILVADQSGTGPAAGSDFFPAYRSPPRPVSRAGQTPGATPVPRNSYPVDDPDWL